MICPACDFELTPLMTGKLTVDVCRGGCGGIWLDNFELPRVDDPHEFEAAPLLQIARDEARPVDPERRRMCPRCDGIALRRHFFSERRAVQVDSCASCGGVWLDAGELTLIRQEKSNPADLQTAANAYFRRLFEQDFMKTRRPTLPS